MRSVGAETAFALEESVQLMQCGAYESEFEKLVCGGDEPNGPLPLIMVGCGVCHEWFFAEVAFGSNHEQTSTEAEERLAQECPNHALAFTIDRRTHPLTQ